MFRYPVDTAIVLGAGFSRESGLPLTRDLSRSIFDAAFTGKFERAITNAIQEFLEDCFRWRSGDCLPTFEDIFTTIDLAANSGHSLGKSFTPKKLRAIRRMLIHRLFGILNRRSYRSANIEKIVRTYVSSRRNSTHFIVLNWDIVLERYLVNCFPNAMVDYCADISPFSGGYNGGNPKIGVAKIHGSANWVYCDNCRSLFYDLSGKLALSIRAGSNKSDFRLFDESFTDKVFDSAVGIPIRDRNCRRCHTAIGSHIATFSFRKSFRTHGFTSAWLAAEQILTDAKNWIFLGYSLPDADFEFKHLLKTCALKASDRTKYPKEITAVILSDSTIEARYRAFFGSDLSPVVTGGIAGFAATL